MKTMKGQSMERNDVPHPKEKGGAALDAGIAQLRKDLGASKKDSVMRKGEC